MCETQVKTERSRRSNIKLSVMRPAITPVRKCELDTVL